MNKRFRVIDVQEPRIIIEDIDSGDSQPLQCEQFELSDDPEAEVLRQEVDRLEQESEELTEFSPGSSFDIQVESD